MDVLKAIIKPLEAPETSVKINPFLICKGREKSTKTFYTNGLKTKQFLLKLVPRLSPNYTTFFRLLSS